MTESVDAKTTSGRPLTSMDVIKAAFDGLQGRHLLDVGCGGGALAAALIKRGANVIGIDPNAKAVAVARKSVPDASFHIAPGETLPFEDGTIDGAVLLNSLHHIPHAAMVPALIEVSRVTGPGSTVVVIEPIAEGSYFEVMRPIEDETEMRAQAQAAVHQSVDAGTFAVDDELTIDRIETITDVDSFIKRIVAVAPGRAQAAANNRDAVDACLKKHGTAVNDGYQICQPLRAHILRVL